MNLYRHGVVRKYALRELLYHNYKHAIYGIEYNSFTKHILELAATADDILYFKNTREYKLTVKEFAESNIKVLAVHKYSCSTSGECAGLISP